MPLDISDEVLAMRKKHAKLDEHLRHYSGSSLGSAATNVATGKAVLLLQHCLQ